MAVPPPATLSIEYDVGRPMTSYVYVSVTVVCPCLRVCLTIRPLASYSKRSSVVSCGPVTVMLVCRFHVSKVVVVTTPRGAVSTICPALG